MKKKLDLFSLHEKCIRSRGRFKYKHLTIHEKINFKGNEINHTSFIVIIQSDSRIRLRLIDGLYILVQYQWAGKERRVYHDHYNKQKSLFNQ